MSEYVKIELVSLHDLPNLLNVRSETALGKRLEMVPQIIHPQWMIYLVSFLMMLGASAGVYIIFTVIQFIANSP